MEYYCPKCGTQFSIHDETTDNIYNKKQNVTLIGHDDKEYSGTLKSYFNYIKFKCPDITDKMYFVKKSKYNDDYVNKDDEGNVIVISFFDYSYPDFMVRTYLNKIDAQCPWACKTWFRGSC